MGDHLAVVPGLCGPDIFPVVRKEVIGCCECGSRVCSVGDDSGHIARVVADVSEVAEDVVGVEMLGAVGAKAIACVGIVFLGGGEGGEEEEGETGEEGRWQSHCRYMAG